MKSLRNSIVPALVIPACLALGVTTLSPARAQMSTANDAAAVKAIDTECSAIRQAVQALKPTHVVLANSTWKVVSDADFAVAEQTRASITLADIWKQGSNYAFVHSHSFDANGNQRATQLCFRQSDGTLERAKQATTLPDLDAAAAQVAYYGSDGTLIMKTAAFEVNDPMLAKTVKSLPFYQNLP
jgi:hypothetical protein